MNDIITGLGTSIDTLIMQFACDISDQDALAHVYVIEIDDETTIVRGMNGSNRFDGYGITKAAVEETRRALRALGFRYSFDEVDGLLHHAEAHRSGECECNERHFETLGGVALVEIHELQPVTTATVTRTTLVAEGATIETITDEPVRVPALSKPYRLPVYESAQAIFSAMIEADKRVHNAWSVAAYNQAMNDFDDLSERLAARTNFPRKRMR